jgi:site-specific DNA-methyltransferase (adenine-specific)
LDRFLNQIICGDCLEVMKEIPDKSVDMILCDLPYGTTACKWDTIIPFEPLWEQYERVIKDSGAIVLFGSEPFSSSLRLSKVELFKYDWVWDKVSVVGFANAKKMPLRNIETVSVFYKSQPTYNPQGLIKIEPKKIKNGRTHKEKGEKGMTAINGGRFKEGYIQEYTNYPKQILTFNREKGTHPTQKPVALFEYLIKTYTNEGETILDNCIGSGTTAVAAHNTGRFFIGIEKEPKYVEIARKRVEQAQSQQSLFG